MKLIKYLLLFGMIMLLINQNANCQAQELEELALDIEKLAQFKQILTDLKKGYEIISGGYNTIKDLSVGNFNLHKTFLDGLLAVSPTVKKYWKVEAIAEQQLALMKEYKAAYKRFNNGAIFNTTELDYISKVYSNLVAESLKNLDALLDIITAEKLRMSDDERVKAIDGIFEGMEDKLSFLRSFNNNTTVLAVQRMKEKADVKAMEIIHGVEK